MGQDLRYFREEGCFEDEKTKSEDGTARCGSCDASNRPYPGGSENCFLQSGNDLSGVYRNWLEDVLCRC
jgi:hypothetical protein